MLWTLWLQREEKIDEASSPNKVRTEQHDKRSWSVSLEYIATGVANSLKWLTSSWPSLVERWVLHTGRLHLLKLFSIVNSDVLGQTYQQRCLFSLRHGLRVTKSSQEVLPLPPFPGSCFETGGKEDGRGVLLLLLLLRNELLRSGSAEMEFQSETSHSLTTFLNCCHL